MSTSLSHLKKNDSYTTCARLNRGGKEKDVQEQAESRWYAVVANRISCVYFTSIKISSSPNLAIHHSSVLTGVPSSFSDLVAPIHWTQRKRYAVSSLTACDVVAAANPHNFSPQHNDALPLATFATPFPLVYSTLMGFYSHRVGHV